MKRILLLSPYQKASKNIVFFLIVFISISFSSDTLASHAAGMDISYECISQGSSSDTYKVTLKFYRDCEGIPAPSSLQLDFSSSCGSNTINLNQVGSSIDINPNCTSYCNGGSGFGIEQYTYEGIITLAHCSNWVLSVCEAARNAAINTINNPGNQDLCVEATINNTTYCNNSPTFTQYPTPFVCAGNLYCYNNGAIELDGDSLVYSLITPLNSNNGGTVNFIAPYSSINPVGGGSSFDPITGNLCVTPTSVLSGILAIKVSEYRNGILIGSIIRDIQINVFNCGAITPPTLSGIDSNNIVDINDLNSYTIDICPDGLQNINFAINTINPPPPPPPASSEITITINTQAWGSEISWDITSFGTIVASGNNYGNYNSYTITACVPIGPLVFNMYDSWGDGWNGGTYSITGNQTLSGTTSGTLANSWFGGSFGSNNFSTSGGTTCNTTNQGALVTMSWNNGIPGATYNITNNNSLNPIGTFNWTPSIADTAGSPYYFTVDVTNSACPTPGNFSFQYQIILNSFSDVITSNITDVSCYGLSNGNINLSVTGNQSPYSYFWNTGDSSQNITNLSYGIYNVMVTDSAGCSSSQYFNVNEPPIFTASVIYNNISCFGSNDGFASVNTFGLPATYLWNTLATSDSIFNLNAGIYSVDITDGNGCTITDVITITEPTAISVIPTISDVNCFNGNDGGIELNIAGGTPNYTISVPPYSQILAGGISNFSTPNVLSAGNYSYTITDSSNCSYTGNVTLINPNPSTSITPITTCDSYSWNGTTYTSSIIQTDTLINQNNCDSIATLNLIITNSSLSNTTINECDSYLWNGINYTTSGLYDSLFTNSANCDSIASLNLTINYSSSSVLSNTSCDYYLWGITNQTYTNSGIYTQISTNSVGCTHIDSLILNINNSEISTDTLFACDSYIWNSNNYLISGIYTDTLTTSFGCDSIATLNLTISDTSSTLTLINECDSFIWIANGQTYFSSTIDTILSTNAYGCPNVDSLILNINYSNSSIDLQVACDTYQWIDGNTYTTSNNTATFLTTNTYGCDSLISLNITINNSTSSFLSDNNCISYQWPLNNQTYTNSGIYTYTSINTVGCIQTDTLNLTINSPNAGSGSINACFFYNWNGNTYSNSGIYTDTLYNIFGCDSIATLNLSISDTSYQTITETECTSYLWPITNTVYINSGTYIQSSFNANGCTHIDSLILTINNTTASYDTISNCDSYSWNGITFNTSGDYNFNLINSKGCDSIANLNLTISNSTSSSFSVSECDSYFWEGISYTMSGTYIRTLNTINGCDSIVTLNLIIISGGFEITTNINITDVDCFGMNNGAINLYPSGGISPLTFSWDNAATTQNINSLTAGNYSFTITDSIGCTLDSTVSVSEPDKLIASFQANNEICRNDSISILIELTNPTYNYYTVQFYDSIQKSFIIDSSGVLIPEGIPFYIIPNFSNQIQLISVTDNNGCTSDINQPLDIIVNELPILEINQDDICVGTPSFTLNEGTPEGGDYFIDGQNTNFFDVENLENGAYTIRYEYTNIITNCSNSIEKIININPNPIADFSFSPQPADIDNPTILFVNESENIVNTKWILGDGTTLTDELEFWHTYADTGTYNVTYAVRNQFNCSDTAKATAYY